MVGSSGIFLATTQSITMLSLGFGTLVWTAPFGISPLEPAVMAQPSNLFYVVTGGLKSVRLSALSLTTGQVVWEMADADARGLFGSPVFDAGNMMFIESFSSSGGSVMYAIDPNSGIVQWKYTIKPTGTVLYDTTTVVGPGMLYVGSDIEVVALQHAEPSSSGGPSGGAIAGAVIGSLIGVGAIVALVWYFKFRAAAGYKPIGGGYIFNAASTYTKS